MGVSYTPTTITTGYNLTKLNANFTAITTALADAVSRSGAGTNTLTANLDANSNKVINLADATNGGDAVSKSFGDARYDTAGADTVAAAASAAAALVSETAADASETAAAASAAEFPDDGDVDALDYLRRNAGDTAYEGRSYSEIRADLSLEVGSDVQAFDADTLKADTADTLTAGFNATEDDAGIYPDVASTFTPDPADGNFQKIVNGGAHTLAIPATTTSIVVQYTNAADAGAINVTAFDTVDGDTPTTTSGHDFLFYIVRVNGFTHLNILALQ